MKTVWYTSSFRNYILIFLAGLILVACSGIASAYTIPFGGSQELTILAPDSNKVYLSLNSRIDWPYLAGGVQVMRLRVNNNPVIDQQLVNKPLIFNLQDGRSFSYYYPQTSSWVVFYSPDFVSPDVANSGYRVLEGSACTYVFDISNYVIKGQTNSILIEHIGPEFISANPGLPVNDIADIESAKIIASSIQLRSTIDEISVPEFPSAFLPVTMIIGFLGAVLFIQRTRK